MNIYKQENSRAFTLVEIVVSLAIFSVVSVVALGALVKIVSANKKAQTLQSAISNLNYALESMSREMRTGNIYSCNPNLVNGIKGDNTGGGGGAAVSSNGCDLGNSDTVAFKSTKTALTAPGGTVRCQLAIAYKFDSVLTNVYTLKKAQQNYCNEPITEADMVPVIDPSVIITNWRLMVTDVSPTTPYQKALIYIDGYVGLKDREKTLFSVQTAVTSRVSEY